MIPLLLASASPRRKELLTAAGYRFHCETAEVIELTDMPARELCLINAELKALEVANRFAEDVVIGADTVVSFEGEVFGKPSDLEVAKRMIEKLCGRVHEVHSGVCLIHHAEGKICRFSDTSWVKFRPREEVNIEEYLQSINPLDKAGGYAAQDDEGRLIERIEGSLSNVVGLPMERLTAALHEHFPQAGK